MAGADGETPARGETMGFYYGPNKGPEPEKEPGGCLEVLLISKAVFSVLATPLLVLVGIVVVLAVLVALFSVHWALGLLGIAGLAGLVALYARWERRRFRSGGF